MKQYSEAFIGFDTAKKKHAVAIADVGAPAAPPALNFGPICARIPEMGSISN